MPLMRIGRISVVRHWVSLCRAFGKLRHFSVRHLGRTHAHVCNILYMMHEGIFFRRVSMQSGGARDPPHSRAAWAVCAYTQ